MGRGKRRIWGLAVSLGLLLLALTLHGRGRADVSGPADLAPLPQAPGAMLWRLIPANETSPNDRQSM
jgi:hypothetical protein